jgi:hypothetical protein
MNPGWFRQHNIKPGMSIGNLPARCARLRPAAGRRGRGNRAKKGKNAKNPPERIAGFCFSTSASA